MSSHTAEPRTLFHQAKEAAGVPPAGDFEGGHVCPGFVGTLVGEVVDSVCYLGLQWSAHVGHRAPNGIGGTSGLGGC